MKKQTLIIASVFLVLFFVSGSLDAQCAMCKQAASSSLDSDPKSIARGLNSGILYLMALPYIMILFIFRKQLIALWKSWRGKPVSDDTI